ISVEKFDRLSLKAETAYEAAAERVQIRSFNVTAPAGGIQGKASIALNTKVGDSTLNAAIRDLDAARLAGALQLPVRIASRATGEVAAHWPALAFEQAAGDATLRLNAAAAAPAKNLIPVAGVINMKTAGNRMTFGISSLRALGAQADGQVTVLNRR